MRMKIQCRDFFQCDEKACPVYESRDPNCWLISGTHCRNEIQGMFLEKIHMCLGCEPFKENIDADSIEQTILLISAQLTKTQTAIEKRDKELKAISMEMAIGLSEVFEALNKISSGDPMVKIPETSDLELIVKLKQMVNRTAENLAEIVDLSHEFAIGLAEHFDVLHRVSKGDLTARVSGLSDVELMEFLKNVTNQMIDSVAREINDRKQAEAELRESEERFRTFAEKAPVGITIMSPDQRFEYINPNFTELFGYTIQDMPTKETWFETAYPDKDYRNTIISSWKKYSNEDIKVGEVNTTTRIARCKDGKDKIVNIRTVVLADGKQFATYSDITARAKAENAIKLSEKRYRELYEGSRDGYALVDMNGRIIESNTTFRNITGYKENELSELTYEDITPEKWRAMEADIIERQVMKRGYSDVYEKEYRKKDETIIPIEIRTYLMRDAEDKPSGMWAFLRDVTDRKLAEEEKKKMAAQLQRSQKMEAIGTLAGGVAHDLNNILSGLVSYPELLLMDISEESPLRKPILTIQKSGEKAAAIVQDLLTLARRGVAAVEVVEPNHIVSEYLKSPEYKRLIAFHPGVEVKTNLQKDLLNIIGSPVHLSKTVMNLVSNATEAMPGGGDILISTENRYIDRPIRGYDDVEEGDYITLSVSDTGVGISAKDMERIFEPFYTKKVMGRSGTGLGMAVVWGTVKDHQGYIDVHSIEGKGATFTLFFPVTRQDLPDEEIQLTLEDYMGNGESILLVDDVAEQREIASGMLTKLGYSVVTVSSGEEAVEYMRDNAADLLVLDMIMDPGIDGLETYRRIIERHPGQKAIIASGFSETDRVREAQRLRAGEYLKKPYTLEKIGVAVKNELDK